MLPIAHTPDTTFRPPVYFSSSRNARSPIEFRGMIQDPQVRSLFEELVLQKRLLTNSQHNERVYKEIDLKKGLLLFGCVLAFVVSIVASIMIPFVALAWLAITLSVVGVASLITAAALIKPTKDEFESQIDWSQEPQTELEEAHLNSTNELNNYLENHHNAASLGNLNPIEYFNEQAELEARNRTNSNLRLVASILD